MDRPRLDRPFDVELPTGSVARVTLRRVSPLPRDLREASEQGAIEASVDVFAAPLADAHVLEALAIGLGAIVSTPHRLTCRNCEQEIEIDAAPMLPLLPLVENQHDPELDVGTIGVTDRREFELVRAVELTRAIAADRFVLVGRTLRDRARIVDRLGRDASAPLRIDGALIRALGVVSVGTLTSPSAIARAIERLGDEDFGALWDAIADAWLALHVPARARAPARCPHCGTRHDLDLVARDLVLHVGDARRAAAGATAFPTAREFESIATEIAVRTIADLVVVHPELPIDEGLAVIVDIGTPPTDDGGDPLLGSYVPTPDADGDITRDALSPFTITLYFKTFRAMFDDEPFDVSSEIAETIVHELEHHVGFLQGDDPLDDHERAEIVREHRRLHGPYNAVSATARELRSLVVDLRGFARTLWPVLLIFAFVTAVIIVISSR